MGSSVTNALLSIIMTLEKHGELDLNEFRQILNNLNKNIFICGKNRIKRTDFAKKLKEHPILIECGRSRIHKLVYDVEEILKEPIYKEIVCRKGSFNGTVYIVYTENQKDMVRNIIDQNMGIKCGGG